MNFIFISPNFPDSYWLFAQGLQRNNVNVFAIGDTPYEQLTSNLKENIDDYYLCPMMEDYDQMLRGVAYFTYKHGKIDCIESNNEYWLRQDARLRMDFNIHNGISYQLIEEYQSKYQMKAYYQKAGIKTARWEIVSTIEKAKAFVSLVHYPLVVKPNVGVGASHTYKLKDDQDLTQFFTLPRSETMIMEEFISGSCFSFDGITDSEGKLLFVTSHQYTDSIMDAVNEHKSIGCYSYINIPEDIMDAGLKTLKAFDTKCRFFHFEFFRLLDDQEGVGKKGEILGLEVNMRPPGGFLPDMINYANDSDVYQLWADMIVHDTTNYEQERRYSSCFIGRRDCIKYAHSISEIQEKYHQSILMTKRLPLALATAMGDEVIVARFPSEEETISFLQFAQE